MTTVNRSKSNNRYKAEDSFMLPIRSKVIKPDEGTEDRIATKTTSPRLRIIVTVGPFIKKSEIDLSGWPSVTRERGSKNMIEPEQYSKRDPLYRTIHKLIPENLRLTPRGKDVVVKATMILFLRHIKDDYKVDDNEIINALEENRLIIDFGVNSEGGVTADCQYF